MIRTVPSRTGFAVQQGSRNSAGTLVWETISHHQTSVEANIEAATVRAAEDVA